MKVANFFKSNFDSMAKKVFLPRRRSTQIFLFGKELFFKEDPEPVAQPASGRLQ